MLSKMRRSFTLALLSLAVVLSLAACDLSSDSTSQQDMTVIPELPTPADTPVSALPPASPAPDVIASPPAITFTLWIAPEISPGTEIPGGSVLLDQLAAFDNSHPDIRFNVNLKSETGQGGMLSYLRTGRGVAPRILPDVMLMPADVLPEAAADGLVQPIDELPLDDEMFADLYPAARSLSQFGGNTYGYPLALIELGHIAYNGSAITRTIPLTWPAFTEIEGGSFVFPAAGVDGAKLALQFYLEHGGDLVDENGAPQLEVEPLTMALRQLGTAAESGFIIPASGTVTTLAESWQLYQAGSASSVQTHTDQFLAQRNLGISASFAPIPGVFDAFVPQVGAWVLVVTTSDPTQQAIAAELVSWLGSAANMGEWSRQSGHVPARRTAFEAWPADDPYANFLRQQAERAQPFPAEATSAILTALANAVSSVVRGESTPAVAAQTASAALRQ